MQLPQATKCCRQPLFNSLSLTLYSKGKQRQQEQNSHGNQPGEGVSSA
jgi:hypothetical protein